MKKPFLVLSLLVASLTLLAQESNNKGIEYYKAGLPDFAKTFFQQQSNPNANLQSQKYYYLGLISIEEGTDSASYYFDKAIEVGVKSPWGYIGKGLLAMQANDQVSAKAMMKMAEKFGKKDPAALVAMAEAYQAAKNKEMAQEYISKAKARDLKHSGIYIAEGDFAMQDNQAGDAQSKYEQAQYFNTADKVATLKIARMYIKMNRKDLALNEVNTILSSEPNNIPATIVYGEIKSSEFKFKEAIAAFEKVMKAGDAPINVTERYAQALYFDKQYQKSLEQIKKCVKENPSNIVNHRIQAYNYNELQQYDKALESMKNLMNMGNEKTIVYQDYVTYGILLTQTTPKTVTTANREDTMTYVNGRNGAINAFNKAIEMKPELPLAYKEFAYSYFQFFDYAKAVEMYDKFFEISKGNNLTIDMYTYSEAAKNLATMYLGKFQNYKQGKFPMTDEEVEVNKADFMTYIDKAVGANENIIKLDTNNYFGYYGKAQINTLVDNYARAQSGKMAGIAKPDYEKAIEKMMAQNQNGSLNSTIAAAYGYFSDYYINQNDVKSTIEVNQKILSFDPENANAKKILDTLKAPYVPQEPKANAKPTKKK